MVISLNQTSWLRVTNSNNITLLMPNGNNVERRSLLVGRDSFNWYNNILGPCTSSTQSLSTKKIFTSKQERKSDDVSTFLWSFQVQVQLNKNSAYMHI